jgi:hypothetical protein
MKRLVVMALLVAGCAGSGLSAQEQKQRCTDFAAEVAKAKLSTTPSQQVALDVANALDAKLSRLGSPSVHDPAVDVHAELHNVEVALKKGDQDRADRAAGKARERIKELAEACGLPESAFLG